MPDYYTMIVGVFPSGAADPANRASPRLPNHYTMIVGVFPSGAADPANRASPRLPNHYTIYNRFTQWDNHPK